ncbi:MAG: hypothetical protein WDN04_11530 [Rhodospirillales bacterium]
MIRSSMMAATAFLGFGALVASTSTASAAIACNAEGVCWHVPRAYAYAPAYGVVVHPDHWRWGPSEHFVWREHPGRGFWRGGVWVKF